MEPQKSCKKAAGSGVKVDGNGLVSGPIGSRRVSLFRACGSLALSAAGKLTNGKLTNGKLAAGKLAAQVHLFGLTLVSCMFG